MKKLLIVSLALINFHFASANETKIQFSPDKGAVTFDAVGRPSMMKIKGKGVGAEGHLSINGSAVTGELQFDLKSLDTGIDLRTEHMKDQYLEVAKFPTATLKIKDLVLPANWIETKAQIKETPFKGELTLHGETQPIEGTFEVSSSQELTAKMDLKISSFKIAIPSYLGITVTDTVKVQVKAKDLF